MNSDLVMDPTQWNVLYYDFTDDIAMVTKAKNEEFLTDLVNMGWQSAIQSLCYPQKRGKL